MIEKRNMKIYVVLYNSCIYESSAAPIGYFRTVASAYKCLRTAILKEFNERRDMVLRYGSTNIWKGRNYLSSQWWGIKKVIVND